MQSHPYENVKARYCLFLLVFTWYLPGVDPLIQYLKHFESYEWYWADLTFGYLTHVISAAFIGGAVLIVRLEARALFGRLPERSDLWPVAKLVIFLYCVASFLVAATYIPLSFVLPGFVSWWLDWMYRPVVYLSSSGDWPVVANILSLLSLVVLAPVLEEILFRGFLFHRLTRKWGLTMGILASSTAFGALHPDTLGAAIFGVGMCLLYLRAGSLGVPILAHGIYNLVVWLVELRGVLNEGFAYYSYTVEQFRNEWETGALSAVVAILIVNHHLRGQKALMSWRLPTA